MTARPAVFISLERWDEVWRRNQHLLTRLRAKGVLGDVLYVEPSVDPMHSLRMRRLPRPGRGLRPLADQPGVAVLERTKFLPRRFDTGSDARWAASVVAAARRAGLRDPLLWVNDPRGAELLDLVSWPVVYDITDDWLLAQRSEDELARLHTWESRLLDRCAEVVVCSPALQRSKSATRDVTLIQNAVDLELYARDHPRPDDLPSGPTALYVGTLHNDRLDVELCCAAAELVRGTGSLIFVGPDALTFEEQSRLDAAGAVRLGPRPAATVPAYLQHADVLVVPHLVNAFTESLDPIKTYEYAAANRPVVSTPVAGFRDLKDAAVVDATHFPATVAAQLTGGRASGKASVKALPSWQDRAAQFQNVLQRIPGQP